MATPETAQEPAQQKVIFQVTFSTDSYIKG